MLLCDHQNALANNEMKTVVGMSIEDIVWVYLKFSFGNLQMSNKNGLVSKLESRV